MTKEFLKGAWKAGIVLEMDTAASSGFDLDGSTVAWGVTNFGTDGGSNALVDNVDATYAIITEKGSASVDEFGPVYDTYQALEDDYDHEIEIRKRGGGSIEFVPNHGDGASGSVPFIYLLYAAIHFPNGMTNVVSNVGYYNPAFDTAITKATDLRGYAVVLEQFVSTGVYYTWTFHNAKISCSVTPGAQKATRATLTWEDARYISIDKAGTSFGNHADT
jgi:hypothetical protein